MSNKAELLKKIKALAERGVDGERESAQTLLARLMEQYGISETEIEEERRETAWFPYSQETERRLLNQIIYMVTGAGGFGCVGEYSGRKRKKMGTECTAAERLEIEANYAFFKEAMKKELEIFFCDRRGSHLDYGETCECVKEAEQEERARNAGNPKDQNRQVQNRGVLDRKAG